MSERPGVSGNRRIGLDPKQALALALLALGLPLSAEEPPEPRPPEWQPARELHVPFEDLNILLHGGTERVLLSRREYEELLAKARRRGEERAPLAALAVSARYDISIRDERAALDGQILIEALEEGLHAVALDIGGIGLRGALLDGKAAPLGQSDDGRPVLFVEGPGIHTLAIQAVMPLQITAAQQILSFRLPAPHATRLRLEVPGDVEVRSGAATIAREFDEAAELTRLELLPAAGNVSLVMSLNSRLKRQDRVVLARSVIVAEVAEAYERLHATVSMDILHRAVNEFRFKLPAAFEVTDVRSPDLSSWAVTPGDNFSTLDVRLREEKTGTVVLGLSAVRTSPDLAAWRLPTLEPLDTAGHAAVAGVLLEERLEAHDIKPEGLIRIDRSVLMQALPRTVLQPDAGEARIRPLIAYYAPQADFSLAARFVRPPRKFAVTSNTLLILQNAGLVVRGGFTILPREERLFEFEFAAPEGWDILTVTGDDGKPLPFERYPAAGAGARILVRLPHGIPEGRNSNVFFTARKTPGGWLDEWQTTLVGYPVFAAEGAARDVGAIALEARDDMRARPERLNGLTPLDQNEKAKYGLSAADATLAYRYESSPYDASFTVERIPSRLTAETYTFFRVKPDVLEAHYEAVYTVEQAAAQKVSLLLPTDTPLALAIRGLRGTKVKEYSGAEIDGVRRWTALLAAMESETVHLALDCQMPLDDGQLSDIALPLVRADGVEYQSGLVAVEGSPELDIHISQHPRKVDIGELTDAEYQPGRRLLGAYGFVGDPGPVRLNVARRSSYGLPPAIVQRAELATLLSTDGLSQSSARFLLQTKVSFVELSLPEGSTLWSAMLDGKPAAPQRRGDSILIGLPADKNSLDLQVVYETPAGELVFRDREKILAPRLFLYERENAVPAEVPLTDLLWSLHLPTGFEAISSYGTVVSPALRPIPLAAGRVAEFLNRVSGGVAFRRGLIGGCSAPLQHMAVSARTRAAASREYDTVQHMTEAPAEDMDSFAVGSKPTQPVEKPTVTEDTRRAVIDRLSSLKIPEMDFRQANIFDVAEFLRQASVEFSGDAGVSPVNIVLDLGPITEAAEVAQTSEDVAGKDEVPLITLRARDISLLEALKIVTEVASLKYRIDGNIVRIVPLQAPMGEIITRMYNVLPAFAEKIESTEDSNWKDFFVGTGVEWPSGGSIRYIPKLGKLMVANTAENIAVFEQRLSELGVVPAHGLRTPKPVWALEGARSLKIELAKAGPALTFRSLGADPVLDVVVTNRRRLEALAWAAALTVLLGGLAITNRTATRKTLYIVKVLLVSTILPVLPKLLWLALALNAAFYAACALVPYYLAIALAQRIRRSAQARASRRAVGGAVAALLCLAAVLRPAAARAEDAAETRYTVEMTPARPACVPADALLVPYKPGEKEPGRVLIPYEEFRALWRQANALQIRAPEKPPVQFALGTGKITASLIDGDALRVEARYGVQIYDDMIVEIPLPLEGAVLEKADFDGLPARLRSVEAAVKLRKAQQSVEQPVRTLSYLYAAGRGSHELFLSLRVKLNRQGGWRVASAGLPPAPAASMDLKVPEADTEVLLGAVNDRASYKTAQPGETIATVLGRNGRLEVRWRPKVGEGEIDRSLSAASRVLMDIEEDCLRVVWQLDLSFRRGEREQFSVELPRGYMVEKVDGSNVRGWEAEDERLTVRLLQRAEKSERFTVHLWRGDSVTGGAASEIETPMVRVPEAVRHTGNLTIRRSPFLDIRVLEAAGVTRTDLASADAIKPLAEGIGESPLGIQPYQTYDFVAEPFSVRVAVKATEPAVTAELHTIVRVAERERAIESRVELAVKDRPVHAARLSLPADMEVEALSAPGIYEWVVDEREERDILTVSFAAGLKDSVPLVIRGRLGENGEAAAQAIPKLTVLDVKEQSGDIVVQSDPSFDVRARDLKNIDSVLLERVHSWLQPNQRALARLALHYENPDYAGRLELVPRKPDVSSYTVTNVRVTDRAIEETILINFNILNAGIRKVSFLIPVYMAEARINVPLLRQKTVTPVADGDLVSVQIVLQDEVMNELRVLIEHDRLLTGEQQIVGMPVVETGRTDRRYAALESAGRDEVVIEDLGGLETLSRQQKEWAAVAPLLRGGTTRAFIAAPGAGRPTLTFRTRQRAAVATAGARIGLARALVIVDAAGSYRASQTYQVDNQTEQFLDAILPAGASLWTALVAGEPVKPVVPEAGDSGRVRIPLVKTAAGDLDYPVVLQYGGRMNSLDALGKVSFPFIRSANINVELSQVELRLPRTHRWFHFGGTMRRIVDEGIFEAGVLSYQSKLAKRLIRTVQFGNVFEKARAASNLRQLKSDIEQQQRYVKGKVMNDEISLEFSNASAVLNESDKRLFEAEQAIAGREEANRIRMNSVFESQNNAWTRNAVLDQGGNWDAASIKSSAGAVPSDGFNDGWFAANSLDNPEIRTQELKRLKKEAEEPPAGEMDPFGKQAQQAAQALFGGDEFLGDQAELRQVPAKGEPGGRAVNVARGRQRRSQKELAGRYQDMLERQAGRAAPERDEEETAETAMPEQEPSPERVPAATPGSLVYGDYYRRAGAASGPTETTTGLTSLGVELPPPDPSRWASYRFTTPRGDIEVEGWTASRRTADASRRLALAVAVLLLLALVRRIFAGVKLGEQALANASTALIIACVLALLLGFLPVAALVLLAVGIVLKVTRAPNPRPRTIGRRS